MRTVRSLLIALGQALLAMVLVSTALARSTVGEAIILHRHDVLRAHLHVLGFGDLLSNAAFSAHFGHSPAWGSDSGSICQETVVIAIIAAGSVFLSDPRPGGDDDYLKSLQSATTFGPQDVSQLIRMEANLRHQTVSSWPSVCAAILLRNHALLI